MIIHHTVKKFEWRRLRVHRELVPVWRLDMRCVVRIYMDRKWICTDWDHFCQRLSWTYRYIQQRVGYVNFSKGKKIRQSAMNYKRKKDDVCIVWVCNQRTERTDKRNWYTIHNDKDFEYFHKWYSDDRDKFYGKRKKGNFFEYQSQKFEIDRRNDELNEMKNRAEQLKSTFARMEKLQNFSEEGSSNETLWDSNRIPEEDHRQNDHILHIDYRTTRQTEEVRWECWVWNLF